MFDVKRIADGLIVTVLAVDRNTHDSYEPVPSHREYTEFLVWDGIYNRFTWVPAESFGPVGQFLPYGYGHTKI